ncbi:MAG: Maf family protein, partial [Chloroflexi bacterium]|nr:Maf family protein [Chloroflexota bacterium]
MIEPSTPSNRQLQGVSTANMPHLVLASGSPRRAQILATAGLEVDVRPTDMPEHRLPRDSTPEMWALRLASGKSGSAARNMPD